MTEPASGTLLRVREVADALAVSTMTVYRLIRAGHLTAIRVGHGWRVPGQAVEAYIERGSVC